MGGSGLRGGAGRSVACRSHLVSRGREHLNRTPTHPPAQIRVPRHARPTHRCSRGSRTVKIERQTDTGYDVVEAPTPAVVSVVEKINEPRYPSFKGIMAAKKKPLTTLSLADAGIEADKVGLGGSGTEVAEFAPRPP